jgi:hypothetical protein
MMKVKQQFVTIKSTKENVKADACKMVGIEFEQVEWIHTECIEPVRPEGMGFVEFCKIPCEFKVRIAFK